MKKEQHYIVNEYKDGWSIEYGIFGLWNLFKDRKHYGTFSIYKEAENRIRELQEAER